MFSIAITHTSHHIPSLLIATHWCVAINAKGVWFSAKLSPESYRSILLAVTDPHLSGTLRLGSDPPVAIVLNTGSDCLIAMTRCHRQITWRVIQMVKDSLVTSDVDVIPQRTKRTQRLATKAKRLHGRQVREIL